MDVLKIMKPKDTRRRYGFAMAGLLFFTLLYCGGSVLSITSVAVEQLLLIGAVFWVGHLGLAYLVISGRSRALPDPSLSAASMIWAITHVSAVLLVANELRPILLMAYLAIMPFGVFQLAWRSLLHVALYAVMTYHIVVLLTYFLGLNVSPVEHEILLSVVFSIALIGYVIVGKEFLMLRQSYLKKNRELRLAVTTIADLAITDELTGLYNRRHMLSLLERQRTLAERDGCPFSVAFIDIDFFKDINDNHGHSTGDQVIVELAGLLQDCVREADVAARYGGEEFVLLLTGTGLPAATPLIERLRSQVEASRFSAKSLPMSVSIGVAEFTSGETVDSLLSRADKALYEAKHSGRNQVCVNLECDCALQAKGVA